MDQECASFVANVLHANLEEVGEDMGAAVSNNSSELDETAAELHKQTCHAQFGMCRMCSFFDNARKFVRVFNHASWTT